MGIRLEDKVLCANCLFSSNLGINIWEREGVGAKTATISDCPERALANAREESEARTNLQLS